MQMNNSPPVDASSTARGLVNLTTQTFAGAKTFLAAIVASAGVQLATIFNTNGGTGGDLVVKAGTSLANASVSTTARVFSVRTGIGGTEVEKIAVLGDGTIDCSNGGTGYFKLTAVNFMGYSATYGVHLNGGGGIIASNNQCLLGSNNGTGASDIAVKMGTYVANGSLNAAMKLLSIRSGISASEVEKLYVSSLGSIGWGTIPNATGTPGAATQNGPKGRAAIAAAAASVVITNSEITADSVVEVIWEADPGARHWVTVAAGSFTLTVSAAPGAAVNFRWVAFK